MEFINMKWYLNCSAYNDFIVVVQLKNDLIVHIQYANKFPSFLWYDVDADVFYSNVNPENTKIIHSVPTDILLVPLHKRIGGYMNSGNGINFIEFDMFSSVEQVTSQNVLMRQPCSLSNRFIGFRDENTGVIQWVPH
jgi:hypothetical protein